MKQKLNDSITVTPSELIEILYYYVINKQPILIKGAPGTGKTDIVKQLAKKLGYKLLISHPVVSDPTDYKGMPCIINDKAEFIPFGDLREMMNATERTIVFFDDIGQPPPMVQASLMQILLNRTINSHAVAECVTFVAATNRKGDMAGVSGILEPVKSRFATILELQPSLDDWCKWAVEYKMPFSLISFMRFKPSFLLDFKPTKDITNSPSARTIANVGYAQNGGLPESLYYPAFSGSAGQGFATEYIAFLKLMNDLPNIDKAIENPNKAKIPNIEKIDVLHAFAGALAQRTNKDNIGNVMKLVNKLPKEFGVLPIRNIMQKLPELLDCESVTDWIDENAGILM